MSVSASTSSLSATLENDRSNPYDSISNAILQNSIVSTSTNSEDNERASSLFLSSKEPLYEIIPSSPPSLYLSSEAFIVSPATVDPSARTSASSMEAGSFSSSNNCSSSSISTNCQIVSSSSQAPLDVTTASKSPPTEIAILYALQNASAVSSMSSSSSKPVHAPQPLHRHQRAHSFTNSASHSVSQNVSPDRGRSRKNSIASITSVSSVASSNCSNSITPSTQTDPNDPLASVPLSRRGSHLLLTIEQIDAIVDKRIAELREKDEWTLICKEELQWKAAVIKKDATIIALNDEKNRLELALNVASQNSKNLWNILYNAENQYFENLAVNHAKYRMKMEALSEALHKAENQSAQIQKELNDEKSRIEKLLNDIDAIFGARRSNASRDINSSNSSTSSASSDPATSQVFNEQPTPAKTENTPENSQSSWWCVIC